MDVQLGDTIRLLRLHHRMTVTQLADIVGVSDAAIDYYENNVWRPGRQISEQLAAAFNITVPELVMGFGILYEEGQYALLVRYLGNNQIKVVGRVDLDGLPHDGQEGI